MLELGVLLTVNCVSSVSSVARSQSRRPGPGHNPGSDRHLEPNPPMRMRPSHYKKKGKGDEGGDLNINKLDQNNVSLFSLGLFEVYLIFIFRNINNESPTCCHWLCNHSRFCIS